MNEIVHRSRSPPLRLVFIFSFFFHASHSIDPCRLLQSPFPRGRPADCDLNDRWISRTDSSSCSSILSILSFPRDWIHILLEMEKSNIRIKSKIVGSEFCNFYII